MLIGDINSIVLNEVIQNFANVSAESHHPLSFGFVLEGRACLRAMSQFEPFLVGVIVLNIQRIYRPDSEAGMPE